MVRLRPRLLTNDQSARNSGPARQAVSDESSSSQEGRCYMAGMRATVSRRSGACSGSPPHRRVYMAGMRAAVSRRSEACSESPPHRRVYMAGRRATVRRRSELGNESTPSSPARIRARGGSSTDRVVVCSRRASNANVSIVNISSDEVEDSFHNNDDDDSDDADDVVDDDDDDSDDVNGDDNDGDSDQDVFEDSFIDDSLADTMSTGSGSLSDSFDSSGSITQPVRRGYPVMNNVHESIYNTESDSESNEEYEPVDVDFTVPTVQDPNESLIKTAEHGDCPICFEDISVDPVGCIYCRKFVGCRRCIQKWVKSGEAKKAQNSEADCDNHDACPLCRHDWGHGVPEVESIFILEFQ